MTLEVISDIMPESQWFAFVNKGEQIQVDKLLQRIGEGDVCLASGEQPTELTTVSGAKTASIELIDYPIDFNVNNILPSNMATVDRSLLKSTLFKTFGYKKTIGSLTIEMVSDEYIYEHNQKYLNDSWSEIFSNVEKSGMIGLWDFLIRNHIKGIIRIDNNEFFLTVVEALGYFQRKIQNINTKPDLGLV